MGPRPPSKRRCCPFCKSSSARILVPPAGFWEARIFPLLGLKPFRCPDCRKRFLGLGSGVHPQERKPRRTPPSPPPPDGELERLVSEIRESERRYGLGTSRPERPEDGSELARRERALLRAEPGAPEDVVDAEILDPLPEEEE